MSRILSVHGVGQQYKGSNVLKQEWLPAMRDGLALAGPADLTDDDLACVFYGDIFRPPGTKEIQPPPFDARDVKAEEAELLYAWAEPPEQARATAEPPRPVAGTEAVKARTPLVVQHALTRLLQTPFFGGVSERFLIADLKQVATYLGDATVRRAVLDRVAAAASAETRVLVGHSLGAVVAYEALHALRLPQATALITLGSPLGMPRVIFDRLTPRPVDGAGRWPHRLRTWVNVADMGDVVANPKRLDPRFEGSVDDRLVHNGARAHEARPYLTAPATGEAIAAALAESV